MELRWALEKLKTLQVDQEGPVSHLLNFSTLEEEGEQDDLGALTFGDGFVTCK